MGVRLGDRSGAAKIQNDMEKHTRASADSLAKLSSGQVFTAQDPRSADRAIADRLEYKLRSLNSSKQSINDGVSLLQTAEGGLSEISNMVIRMKEINIASASNTINDKERKYLFIEYQALHNEIDRISATTEFNGIPLLNGKDERSPETTVLRLGDPTSDDAEQNLNEISLGSLRDVVATTLGLGLKTAADTLLDDDEISIDTAMEFLEADDSRFGSIYDQALETISSYRASFGAIQARLGRAKDYNEVAHENISAAKSRIADTDYASEFSKLTQSNMLMQTASALLTQNNLAARIGLNLVNSLLS